MATDRTKGTTGNNKGRHRVGRTVSATAAHRREKRDRERDIETRRLSWARTRGIPVTFSVRSRPLRRRQVLLLREAPFENGQLTPIDALLAINALNAEDDFLSFELEDALDDIAV